MIQPAPERTELFGFISASARFHQVGKKGVQRSIATGSQLQDVIDKHAMLEGGHPLSGLCVASGTNAVFYSLINLARQGDNIVSSRALYGGTYTQFEEILPQFGIEVRFVDAEDPENYAKATDAKTRAWF